VYDIVAIETVKKTNDGNQRKFYVNFHLTDGPRVEFVARRID